MFCFVQIFLENWLAAPQKKSSLRFAGSKLACQAIALARLVTDHFSNQRFSPTAQLFNAGFGRKC
jgi:hypothetical protein